MTPLNLTANDSLSDLFGEANTCAAYQLACRRQAVKHLSAIIAPLLQLDGFYGKGRYFPSLGGSFNREMCLAIALNTGNPGNLQHLLQGAGWRLPQLEPLLNTLTAEEWLAVQAVWDLFSSWQMSAAALQQRLYGNSPDWLQPKAFTVNCQSRSGQPVELFLHGGCYPLWFTPTPDRTDDGLALLAHSYFTGAAAGEARPLLYSLSVAYDGAQQIIQQLAWQAWLVKADSLLAGKNVSQAICLQYGQAWLQQFKQRRRQIAAGYNPTYQATGLAVGQLQIAGVAAGLGFAAMIATLQALGFGRMSALLGPGQMAEAINGFLAEAGNTDSKVVWSNWQAEATSNPVGLRQDQLGAPTDGWTRLLGKARQILASLWRQAVYQQNLSAAAEAAALAQVERALTDMFTGNQDLSKAQTVFKRFYGYVSCAFKPALPVQQRAQQAADLLHTVLAPALGYCLQQAVLADGADWQAVAETMLAEKLDQDLGLLLVAGGFVAAEAAGTGVDFSGLGVEAAGFAEAFARTVGEWGVELGAAMLRKNALPANRKT